MIDADVVARRLKILKREQHVLERQLHQLYASAGNGQTSRPRNEKAYIIKQVLDCGYSRAEAARILGVSRPAVTQALAKYPDPLKSPWETGAQAERHMD